ncbi:CoA transferase [Archangium lansingense]|uniref:CoA transferase n=1 Tax=Archangium lansingense TaxID=2995310 RepID=UPI003B780D21
MTQASTPVALTQALSRAVRTPLEHDRFDIHAELTALLAEVGFSPEDCGGEVRFNGLDPLMPSVVRLGGSAALGLAQQSVVAAKLWRMRGGAGQNISIELAQAIRRLAPATERKWELLNGYPASIPDPVITSYLDFFPTRDGRTVLPANIYPGIKSKMLEVLDSADNPQALRRAIARHDADALEKLGEEQGIVMAKIRSLEEFLETEAYAYLANRPLIEIEKIADSAPEPLPTHGLQPLSGIRALGMGHVIAGAGIGRSLASLGADVLNVWRPRQTEHDAIYCTANVGMRSTRLEPCEKRGAAHLRALLEQADIFFANRRPRLLTELGLDLQTATKIRPGLIHVTVSTHGEGGPWAKRVGFDQVAGAVTGMVVAEGTLEKPKLPPTGIVNDYLVAWLGATGAMVALARRATEGGSYRVHVSLSRAALWILSLGLFDKGYVKSVAGTAGAHALIDPELFTARTSCGVYQGVTENVFMSATPRRFETVLVPRGSSDAVWLPR